MTLIALIALIAALVLAAALGAWLGATYMRRELSLGTRILAEPPDGGGPLVPMAIDGTPDGVTVWRGNRRDSRDYARSEHPHEAVTLDYDHAGNLLAVEILGIPRTGSAA